MDIIINQTAKPNSLLYKSWTLIVVMSFLFSLHYHIVENLWILIISIVITLPNTLICATSNSHSTYIKSILFNTSITLIICLYPLFQFNHLITFLFIIYCVLDGYFVKQKWNRLLKQAKFTHTLSQKILNRDQFTLDYELQHGRIWQLKYHTLLLVLIFLITIPLTFFARAINSLFLYIPVSLFFSFILWEYTFKRFYFFWCLFRLQEIKKAH